MGWLGSFAAVSLVLLLTHEGRALEESIDIDGGDGTREQLTQFLRSFATDLDSAGTGFDELKNQTSDLLSDIRAFKLGASAEDTRCRQLVEWSEELSSNFGELQDLVINETSSWTQSSNQALEELVQGLQRSEAGIKQGFEEFSDALGKAPSFGPPEPLPQPVAQVSDPPKECNEALIRGGRTGVTTIAPKDRMRKQVWCDQDTDGGGWLVIVKRQKQDHQVDFARTFQEYLKGFGDASGEYWIGLDALEALTIAGRRPFELLVTMAIGPEKSSSFYESFSVGNPSDYRLSVSHYSASRSTGGDSLTYHNGMPFSTTDRDRDGASGGSCADWSGGGGWWYDYCYFANPTGLYGGDKPSTDYSDSYLEWRKWQGYNAYLTDFAMMIRPKRS